MEQANNDHLQGLPLRIFEVSGRTVEQIAATARYERARREDIAAMQAATDALQRLFNNDSAALARVRNFGLRMTNRQHMLKNLLVRHAVG